MTKGKRKVWVLCLWAARRYNTHLTRRLSFKFLLNSIWYFLFHRWITRQTIETSWLSMRTCSMGTWWLLEGGERWRKALLVSNLFMFYLSALQVSLLPDKWRPCPGNSSQKIIFSIAIYNYTSTVPFHSPCAGCILQCIFLQLSLSNEFSLFLFFFFFSSFLPPFLF